MPKKSYNKLTRTQVARPVEKRTVKCYSSNGVIGIWDIFWSSGMTNPLTVIEQIT